MGRVVLAAIEIDLIAIDKKFKEKFALDKIFGEYLNIFQAKQFGLAGYKRTKQGFSLEK